MSQELKKSSKKQSRNGIDKMNGSNWPYFASLKFLIPIFSKDSTQATCTLSSMTIVSNIYIYNKCRKYSYTDHFEIRLREIVVY